MAPERLTDNNRSKILVVDDRPKNLLAIETALKHVDAEIIKARSGNEALALMLRHELAVVLLDVQMPEMDGFEVATLMRVRRPGLRDRDNRAESGLSWPERNPAPYPAFYPAG